MLTQNNLASFLENYVDTSVKLIDGLDFFKEDGLVASIPYGKLVSYLTKKLIEIKDPNVALKKLITTSISLCFIEGLKKHNLEIDISKVNYDERLQELKKTIDSYLPQANTFDMNDFNGNESITFYSTEMNKVFKGTLSDVDYSNLLSYRKDYLKVHFLKLLETNTTIYANLISLLGNKSHDEIIKLSKIEKYRTYYKNLFHEIVLEDEKGMTLSNIYVEPSFSIHIDCLKKNAIKDGTYPTRNYYSTSEDSIHEFIYKHLENELPDEYACRTPNLFFILGYPGQGKSSFCKKFLNDVYSNKTQISKEIYFAKFRSIINSSELINDPIETIYKHWKEENDFEHLSKNDFKQSILVLDGLDELFMKDNLPTNAIDEFCRILTQELERSPNTKVIITSRYGYVDVQRLRTQKSALIIQLDGFSLAQQQEWLKKYHMFHPDTTITEAKIASFNSDDSFKSIRELIAQPILLHMIVTLNQEISSDMNKAAIYSNLFDNLIQRKWAKEGQIGILEGLTQHDLRNFLREIAYEIFISGYEYIHKSKLVELESTKEFLSKLTYKSKVQDVLKNIMVAFYFQEIKKQDHDRDRNTDNSDYAIEFLHKSLQEYLVAEKIWEALLSFTDKINRTEKFVIGTALDALKHLNELFQDNYLSTEIENSFKDIVSQKPMPLKKTLVNRFETFLPEWLEHGFLLDIQWGKDNLKVKARRLFKNSWFIITNIIPNHDYLINTNPYLLDSLSDNHFSDRDLSGQTLTGNLVISENEVSEIVDNLIMYYNTSTSLRYFTIVTALRYRYNSEQNKSKITFNNLLLKDSAFVLYNDVGIVSVKKCIFDNSRFTLTSKNHTIQHSIFIYSHISIDSCSIDSCQFACSTITLRTVMALSNIKKSIFEECTFYIYDDYDMSIFNTTNSIRNCAIIKTDSYHNEYAYSSIG